MTLTQDLLEIPRDKDSHPGVVLGQLAYLKKEWCNFEAGSVFYVVALIPCVGGSVLRYNARVVQWEAYASGQQDDSFHFRTVPAEHLRWAPKSGDDFEVNRNQGERDAYCLGRINKEALCAYQMPAGRWFLFIESGTKRDRPVSLKALPKKWLENEDVQILMNNLGIN